jgi:hypothetical protein
MNGRYSDSTQSIFEKLYHHAKRIDVDGVTYWRIEGDTLLNEVELRRYAQSREALLKEQRARTEAGMPLVANIDSVTEGHKIVRWAPGMELSYSVLRKTFTFGGNAGYQLAVDSVRRAATDWEKTCGVKFAHKAELDGNDSLHPEGALFVVREFDAHGQLIAAAFFPGDPTDRRRVLIDPSFYRPDLGFDKVGVLRHELGHVLGFRHEQIRPDAPPGCPDEDTYGTINLTKYDPRSVMHYFCGGVGSKELVITDLDKAGAQNVYGAPLTDFHFVR